MFTRQNLLRMPSSKNLATVRYCRDSSFSLLVNVSIPLKILFQHHLAFLIWRK